MILFLIIIAPFLYGIISSLLFRRFYPFIAACVVSMSQALNAFYAEFFNHALLKKKGAYLFGDPNETTSYVLGRNRGINNLTLAGLGLAKFLNWLDPDHVEDASQTPQ